MAKWGSCDFEQLKELQRKLEKLQSKGSDDGIDKFCEECAKELAARLLAQVIKRTPTSDNLYETVDVVDDEGNAVKYKRGAKKGQIKQKKKLIRNGGTLKRGWTAESESEALSGQGAGNNAREYANSLKIAKVGGVYQIEIINPVHYASYVEYGHRQTPGRYVPAIGKKLKSGWVKGQFMLTISEKELDAQAPAILEKKLIQYLGDAFNAK